MAINDNLWITQGNDKRFAFELKDDEGKVIYDLDSLASLEFVLVDLDMNEVLRLVPPNAILLNQRYDETNMRGWVTVVISNADSKNVEIGMYRYALQARWPDGRTREWTFSNVMHVLAGIIS